MQCKIKCRSPNNSQDAHRLSKWGNAHKKTKKHTKACQCWTLSESVFRSVLGFRLAVDRIVDGIVKATVSANRQRTNTMWMGLEMSTEWYQLMKHSKYKHMPNPQNSQPQKPDIPVVDRRLDFDEEFGGRLFLVDAQIEHIAQIADVLTAHQLRHAGSL